MKKIILTLTFVIAYAALLSIGIECLLNLLGISMAISPDNTTGVNNFPRFVPFCLIVGFLALVAIVAVFILHLIISEKSQFFKEFFWVQIFIAVVLSVPMIEIWEILFEFLRKTF